MHPCNLDLHRTICCSLGRLYRQMKCVMDICNSARFLLMMYMGKAQNKRYFGKIILAI